MCTVRYLCVPVYKILYYSVPGEIFLNYFTVHQVHSVQGMNVCVEMLEIGNQEIN